MYGRPRRWWEDNIRRDAEEIVWRCGMDWFGSEYGPAASSCEHGNEPSGSVTGENFFEQLNNHRSLSRIWGSHGGEYEDGCLLGCSAV
jgi:hypothetical protein